MNRAAVKKICILAGLIVLIASAATAIQINSSKSLKYYGNGQTLDFLVGTDGAITAYGNLNVQNNITSLRQLQNFFAGDPGTGGGACPSGQFVQTITADGSYKCDSASSGVSNEFVNVSGDAMTGMLNMTNNSINNVSYLNEFGNTLRLGGQLAMQNSRITGLATPSAGSDAATKDYVDTNDDTIPDTDDQNLSEVLVHGNVANMTIDMSGNSIVDGGTTVWDASNGYVPSGSVQDAWVDQGSSEIGSSLNWDTGTSTLSVAWSDAAALDSSGDINDFSSGSELTAGGAISTFANASDLTAAGDIASFDDANDLFGNGNVTWKSAADLDGTGSVVSTRCTGSNLLTGDGSCVSDSTEETTEDQTLNASISNENHKISIDDGNGNVLNTVSLADDDVPDLGDFGNANDLDSNGNVQWQNAAELTAGGAISTFANASDLTAAGDISDFSDASDLDTNGDLGSGVVTDTELDNTGSFSMNSLTVTGSGVSATFQNDVQVQGDLDVWGNITNTDVQNLNVNGSILPPEKYDNTFDLGSSTRRWQHAYFGGNINVGGTVDGVDVGNPGNGVQVSSNQYTLVLDGGTLSLSASGLKVASGGIDTNELTTGAVGNTELQNGAVNETQIANFGCSSGQVMYWTGSQWGCTNDDSGSDTQNLGTSGNKITLTNSPSIFAPFANNSDKLDGVELANINWGDVAMAQSDISVADLGAADADLNMNNFDVRSAQSIDFGSTATNISTSATGSSSSALYIGNQQITTENIDDVNDADADASNEIQNLSEVLVQGNVANMSIDMGENAIQNVNALQDGTGTNTLTFDGSNNVNIPNGNLDVGSPSNTGGTVDVGGNMRLEGRIWTDNTGNNDAFMMTGGGTSSPHTIRFDDRDLRFWTGDMSGTVMRLYNDTGNVEIPNGNLDMSNNNVDKVGTLNSGGSTVSLGGDLQTSGNNITSSTGNVTIATDLKVYGDLWLPGDGPSGGSNSQNLSEVLVQGNVANMSIDMNTNNIDNVNTINSGGSTLNTGGSVDVGSGSVTASQRMCIGDRCA